MIYKARSTREADDLARWVSRELGAIPYKHVQASILGGLERASIIVRVSIDPQNKWKNGIYHNSRYAMFHLSSNGALELFSRRYDMPKMRKAKAKTLGDAVKKMKDYLRKVKGASRA